METEISFTKVALPYGWLGNMSPYPIEFIGQTWRTTEALFQALRFEDPKIREAIRMEKSPMGAKMKAKKHKSEMSIIPMSEIDVEIMKLCIVTKLSQYPELQEQLKATGDVPIYEDVTSRPRGSGLFWGAMKTNEGWSGKNILGEIWMELRKGL